MFGRIIIFFIRVIQSVEDGPNFPESVIIVGLLVKSCIVVCKVQETKIVQESVAFHCVAVKRRVKLFSCRPVILYSVSNVMSHLNNDP
jgi:hypothetical protein